VIGVKHLLSHELFSDSHIDEARILLTRSLDRFEAYENPLQGFLYYNRVLRDTAILPYEIICNPIVLCPLNSRSLVNFAMALPWEVSSDSTFQTKAIRYLYPEQADIPFTEEYLPPSVFLLHHTGQEAESIAKLIKVSCNMWSRAFLEDLNLAINNKLKGGLPLKNMQIFAYISGLVKVIELDSNSS
jgi:hypothetical protein